MVAHLEDVEACRLCCPGLADRVGRVARRGLEAEAEGSHRSDATERRRGLTPGRGTRHDPASAGGVVAGSQLQRPARELQWTVRGIRDEEVERPAERLHAVGEVHVPSSRGTTTTFHHHAGGRPATTRSGVPAAALDTC